MALSCKHLPCQALHEVAGLLQEAEGLGGQILANTVLLSAKTDGGARPSGL